jgi:hypothetical protein
MSYCRWSSNDFQCDIYCYFDVYGYYVIHVAGRRPKFIEPLPPPSKKRGLDIARHREVMRIVGNSPSEDIGLPFDGETYRLSTPGETAAKLEELKEAGYNVPDYAIEILKEEERDRD